MPQPLERHLPDDRDGRRVQQFGHAGPDEPIPEPPEATPAPEFISIPEWARRIGISKDSAYKAARIGQIPGCFAIGRLYRVNWSAFVERSGLLGGEERAEEVGGVLVPALDHVGILPQRGRGVRVA